MSEGPLDDALVHAAVGIAYCTPDLVITEVNPKLCAILGYERAELIGMAASELLLPEERAELDPIPDLIRRGILPPFPIERQYLRKDRTTVWLLVTGAVAPGHDGRSPHLVCYYHDISDRKRADQSVVESEARFRSYFEHAPIAVLVHDATGRYIDSNPAAQALLGYAAEEILQLHVKDTRTADDQRRWQADLASVDTLGVLRIERAVKRRDGSLVPVEVSAVKVDDDRVIAFMQDISFRHRAEAELRHRLRLQDQMIRTAATVPGLTYAFVRRPDGSCAMPHVTSHFEDLHGLKPEDVVENVDALLAGIHPDDREAFERSIAESARDLSPWHGEYRYVHPTKGIVWIEGNSLPRAEADGSIVWYGFASDVTARKKEAAALRDASAVFANADESVILFDFGGTIASVNAAFCARTGYGEEEVIGRNLTLLRSDKQGLDFYEAMERSVHETGSWQGEAWYRIKNGEALPAYIRINSVLDPDGRPVRRVMSLTDITRVKEQQLKLERLVRTDTLTDLPNRSVFLDQLSRTVGRAMKTGKIGALLLLNLDRFKLVNESLGRPAGDEILKILAGRLRSRLRDTDLLARLGGNEFGIVLEDIASAADAGRAADSLIRQVLEPTVLVDGREIIVSASVGVSVFPADGEDAEALLRCVDAALHKAKADGRGIHRYFTADLTHGLAERFDLEGRLRRAIERQEFVLHHQPLISLADRTLKGLEALVRWEDPERGRIPPGQFIPLAEETGLIIPLGDWVLRAACTQLQAWRGAGIFDGTVAVNLSPVQFRQRDIAEQVAIILAETGLPSGSLELEITEGALIGDVTEARTTLARLKALGVRLAIDDFGTGYSSLAYLKRFPIDKLKIDQSFVQEIPQDPADMEIANAVISLARSLNLESLAEGIETEAQLEFLERCGCATGQGYLFARPMPVGELETFIARYPCGNRQLSRVTRSTHGR